MRLYIFTEDSGGDGAKTVEQMVLHMLKCVDPEEHLDTSACKMERVHLSSDRANRMILHANGWKSPKHKYLPELIRHLTDIILMPNAFAFFHFDADCHWSSVHEPTGRVNLDESENWSKFEEVVIQKVITKIEGHKYSYANARRAVSEKLFRLIPFYSIESWLFQNIEHAQTLKIKDEDTNHFANWDGDPCLIDDFLQPKKRISLCDAHNLALATTAYPVQKVYEARRSFWWSVKQMEGSWALRCALETTRRP